MCSQLPKDFQKSTQVLPFTKYGVSSLEDFREAEKEIQHLEWLKKVGLTSEEIKIYQENEAGLLDPRKKVESNALKSKLETIYYKINESKKELKSSLQVKETPSSSTTSKGSTVNEGWTNEVQGSINHYTKDHPINELKELEEELFGHLKNDSLLPITKRRKILRRLERKKERLLAQQKCPLAGPIAGPSEAKPGSLWDLREVPKRVSSQRNNVIGPKKQTMYTVKDNKIVRLEPIANDDSPEEEYRAVDIVVPVNAAEEQLLEGTKMCLDDIMKIDRFKDYEPGIPSKILYLKNISPSVSQEQLLILFNQFQLENGGPVDLKLMTGRMHGQAFVTFQTEDLAIQALEEINGTIMGGQPIIAQFGRNSNRIQEEENR